jgi:hypothetical protein
MTDAAPSHRQNRERFVLHGTHNPDTASDYSRAHRTWEPRGIDTQGTTQPGYNGVYFYRESNRCVMLSHAITINLHQGSFHIILYFY